MQIPHLFPVNLIRLNVWNAKRHAILNPETKRDARNRAIFPSSFPFVPYFTADGTRRVEERVGGGGDGGGGGESERGAYFWISVPSVRHAYFSSIRWKGMENWKLLRYYE